jgi:hypothetical protein
MTVSGSSLTNISSGGLPVDSTVYPTGSALGSQVYINPVDDPTDSVLEFVPLTKGINVDAADGTSTVAIGFANDQSASQLTIKSDSDVDSSSVSLFGVGFARRPANLNLVSVNVEGVPVKSIARPMDVELLTTSTNTFTITNHPFNTGDPIRISSTGALPSEVSSTVTYYAIRLSSTTLKIASSLANANAGGGVNLSTNGTGTISISSYETFTLKRVGNGGQVVLLDSTDSTLATFTNTSPTDALRAFYWNRESSVSSSQVVFTAVKVKGAI